MSTELQRALQRWALSDPKAMAGQSTAAIEYALKDAKEDIAYLAKEADTLRSRNEVLSAALKRLVAVDDAHETIHAQDGDDIARMIEYAAAFEAARAALSGEPNAHQA